MQYPHNSHDRNSSSGPHFPAKLPPVQLEIVRGQAQNRLRPIDQRAYLFGASSECDLVLRDPTVDDVQGYILSTPQGVWVRQLGQQTSLAVNGRPVRCMLLLDKDRLTVGPFEFRVHIQGTEAAATTTRPSSEQVPRSTKPVPSRGLPEHGGRVDAANNGVPAPKFMRRAAAVSRGTQHSAAIPPSWRHLSHDLLVD